MKRSKIVLAYSGGLDTSVALRWLRDTREADIYCVIVDVGQREELASIARRAMQIGAADVLIEDARDDFAREFVFPMLRANARYEGAYLMGSCIARPLIARRQVECARRLGADALAHGATGKGNDQIRFELTYAALAPDLQVIAPWRIWDLRTRLDLIAYARDHSIPITMGSDGGDPMSIDQNLMHTSYEGHLLEDPSCQPPDDMFLHVPDVGNTPDDGELVTITIAGGDARAVNGTELSPREALETLNRLGERHGIGRCDMVESRILGMKSRNVYETPGATILHAARRAAEGLCLDKEVLFLQEELMPRYARMVYHGLWFSPERQVLQVAFDKAQEAVNATIIMRLRKGIVDVVERHAAGGLYHKELASFDDRNYRHGDAEGYLRLAGLRLRLWARSRAGSLGGR
ncbi:argininosuccinate synthase [Sorangium cellulosum]|uniref:argininosuccinate synthase n=1 Tax=Sorangium cellulosum TaxID=56 RepID=UPI003D9A91EF